MQLKATVNKQEFFDKLIKSKCNFKRVCGLYPAKCKNVKYIGQLKNFSEISVYQLNDEEAAFFKKVFTLFPGTQIELEIKNP